MHIQFELECQQELRQPKRIWEGNIKMELKKMACDSSGSGHCPVAASCEHGNKSSAWSSVRSVI
jgi:hypothetical protein